ncbi:MAG: prolipoprotein diacylglyceryl transferase [Oscillospiraceae bacterium]|nr:prolipoprotein diacylglyceryl transferase [Oscillospiraceae bacterium]MCI9548916.1 prolipoprotein diacylglyceryl transferase [Oscillospiraceae bacterium]
MTNTVFFPGLGLEFELDRVAFSVFGHNIYWYGVIIAAGFLLAVAFGLWKCPKFGMDPDTITDAIFVVVPSAILGARLYYVIFNPAVCFTAEGSFSLLRAVAFWDGGLAIYGGVIATVVSALLFCKVRKVDFWSGMDITVYGLLIGQMIGRWGNFVNVEAYGGVTDLPWRMCSESIANELWRDGLLESNLAYESVLNGTLGVHPTFLYESLWNLLGLILLILLMKKGRKFNGQMFLSYVIWYGLGRAAIEGLRTDSLYFFGTPIRSSQMLGVVSAAAAIGLYVYRRRTAGPATPPLGSGAAAPAEEMGQVPAERPAEAVRTQEQNKEESGDGGDTDRR